VVSLAPFRENLKQNNNQMKKKTIAAFLLLVFASSDVWAFCGFYVSKADGTLTNKTSQVILVRDGDRTIITMSNDFKGDVTDFAMVVPVPTVLKKSDIKVVEADLFQRLNDYSKPRLVEYYDQNPCQQVYPSTADASALKETVVVGFGTKNKAAKDEAEYKVTVEATYTVGEYDIVILSAEESGGLYKWLTANKYKIPKGAEEVLEPYIKSNMKFFVVKVNIEEQEELGFEQLRPIQIKFNSPKFMLPIRLGMANANGDQDMIVYSFTRNGRIESTNYRTVQMPTAKNIPLFVNTNFGGFYANAFQHQWAQQQNSLFLEYAWDVSPSNYVKCDPCVSDPPNFEDLKKAGVWWLGKDAYNDYVNQYETQKQTVFFTRLHVRYNRKSFAQDLIFQETPNRENYQARYIITHPATGDLNCEAGKRYLKELKERRKKEMDMLATLTGKGYDDWDVVMDTKQDETVAEVSYATVSKEVKETEPKKKTGKNIFMASLALLSLVTMFGATRRRKEK
jgi:hypothetical protein